MRAIKLWVFWLLTIGFRLGIWLLLSSDTSQFNLFVGVLLAVALPRSRAIAVAPGLVLGLVWKVIMALPEAYGEAVQMLSQHHGRERLGIVPGSGSRSSLVVFLEVFLITLTPLTIALGRLPDGSYQVHQLERGKP
ncbi:MAG: hypothetical protein HQ527_05665 [Cyanobacteria bacterium]|nr:hypothetical protein [Cyanobacteria bacterium bin.51]